MKKKIITMGLIGGLALFSTFPALADEWLHDDRGWWYMYNNGTYASNGMRLINGQEYLFGQDGYLLTGWQTYEWKWYYFDENGNKLTGWQNLGGKWYYLDENGVMKTGMLKLGGDWYYLNDDGSMQTQDFTLDDIWYSPDPVTGRIQRNKKNSNNPNIKYSSDGSVMRKNASGEWEVMESDRLAEALKEAMKEDYLKSRYRNTDQFEEDVRTTLDGLTSTTEIEDFIYAVEYEYQSSHEGKYSKY